MPSTRPSTPVRQPRRHRWRWKFLGLIGGTVTGLLLAELALRLLGISYPLPYVPDPYCGSRLRSGMSATFMSEGRARVRINQAGFRDRDHARRKPPGAWRIAVLGDSYAEALQVSRPETFWSILETRLQGCAALADKRVEVLNFGVSGFGTAQALEMLRHEVWQYEPDVILLAFCTGNDVSDNSQRLSPDGVRPYFIPTPSGLRLDRSFRRHPHYLDARSTASQWKVFAINHLRLLQVARHARARVRERRQRAVGGAAEEPGLAPVYHEPRHPDWQEAWQITETLLAMMHDESRQRGAEFWLVTLSNGIQVDPDPQVRQARTTQLGVSDLFYPERRLRQLGHQLGFPVITLAPEFQRHAERHQVYLHGFANTRLGTGHWNAEGHRLAGNRIAEVLCRAWQRGAE